MNKSKFPLREKTIEQMHYSWLLPVKTGESVSVVCIYKNTGSHEVYRLSSEPERVKMIIGKVPRFMVIDLSLFLANEADEIEELIKNLLKNDLKIKKQAGLGEMLKDKRCSNGVVVFLLRAEKIISNKSSHILAFLNEADIKYNNLSLISFFSSGENLSLIKAVDYPFFARNIVYLPLYEEKDIDKFVKYYENKWNFKLNKEIKKNIYQICGGHLWLVKQSLRFCHKKNCREIKDVLADKDLLFRAKLIYESFSDVQKKVLEKIIRKENITDKEEREDYDFFVKMRMVWEGRKRLSLIFEKHIKENVKKKAANFKISHGKISFNGVIINDFFSKKEKKVLNGFITKKGMIISREELASFIWPVDTDSHYSEWAIDQLVCRIRKKLNKLGAVDILMTARNKGYIFIFQKDND